MNDIDILLEFLEMPDESTDALFEKFATIPNAIRRGNGLEQFLFKEGTRNDSVLLVAHADTYWDSEYKNSTATIPKSIIQTSGIIRNENGGLGADDRAGCAIVWLLKDMGHSILITNGEECRQRGSNWIMNENHDIAEKINSNHQFIIQFDRRNGKDFKCYDVGTDEFRSYVKQISGYSEPDTESLTDIRILCRDICGVNLSIGYYNGHCECEHLNVYEWMNTLNLCRQWLSGSELPRFSRKIFDKKTM